MLRLDARLQAIRDWDVRVCARMNRAMQVRLVHRFFRAASDLGDGLAWYVLMLGLLIAEGSDAAFTVIRMILTGIVATLVYRALKTGTVRPRPYQVHAHIAAGATPLDRFSFPSGHTLHAVAFSLLATSEYPALASVLIPFTACISASRIVLGLHYPSDVLAGATLGASLALVALQIG